MTARPAARYLGCLALALALVLLDQGTKQLALSLLAGRAPVAVLPVLEWTLVFNRGAAFGFLAGAGDWGPVLLSGLAVAVCLGILAWLWRACRDNRLAAAGLVLVLGGALGNLADRLAYGFVIDFISLHYGGWYFPAFNVADMALTFGAVCLVADSLGIGSRRPRPGTGA